MTAATLDISAARRHAEEMVKRSGTSFGAGMAILPKKRREAMYAIYAFCREVDDIADDALPAAEKMRRLYEWRGEIDRIYAGRPLYPTGAALLEPVRAYGLPKQEFQLLIEGMEMDADGPIVAPSMDRLFAYTRRVAGAVGMLSMPVFGAPKGAASDDFALSLGDALQLTNILRDVAEDAAIGRLYLPAELLEKHGALKDADAVARALNAGALLPREAGEVSAKPTEGALSAIPALADRARPLSHASRDSSPASGGAGDASQARSSLAAVARDLAQIAAQKFEDARAALEGLDWRTVRPALLMMGVYEAYLAKMERRGWDRLGEPLSIAKAEKFLIAARYALAPPRRYAMIGKGR